MHIDEQAFVASAVAMLDAGDLDHRYHKYPGLFFYLLAACIAPLGPEGWHTNDAYVVARGVVATFGVLNVAALAFAATRWIGPQAGLVAALLAAVSPVDVHTSQQVRPDVLLQLFGLFGVAALRGVGDRLRGDVLVGLAIGLAGAVKYTAVLMVPSYLLARLVAPGPRLRGLVLAGLVTAGTVLAFTPVAVLDPGAYRSGPPQHLHPYYRTIRRR
jgi:4-amino-4-deoxy-L-arabinose transferase-like glycosyltransferase